MKELLEDMLEVLNAIPNRKLRGKDWTTYDLAKRVEEKLKNFQLYEDMEQIIQDLNTYLQNETNTQTD